MLAAAARTPKVVQTLAEALIYKRTAKGEKRSRPIAWENLFCWLGSASGVSASSPRSAGNRPSSHEERKPKLGFTLPAARRPPPRGAVVEVVVGVRVGVPRAQFRDQRPRAAPGAVD